MRGGTYATFFRFIFALWIVAGGIVAAGLLVSQGLRLWRFEKRSG